MSNNFTPPSQLNTPVLFLVFNRPETTKEVFKAIKKAKPPRLYVAADGPRKGKAREMTRVKEVRRIATNIDWDCEIYTLFREENLGCKYAVSNAITWFFNHEEQGIILEDDCLPSQSFFWFCEEMLKRYNDNPHVSQVCGRYEYEYDKCNKSIDYFFTSRGFIWGWATWRRSAVGFDVDFLEKNKLSILLKKLWNNSNSTVEFVYRANNIISVRNNNVSSWAYPWNIFQLLNARKTIIPKYNLISNIGFSKDATHTKSGSDKLDLGQISIPVEVSDFVNKSYTDDTILKGRNKIYYLLSMLVPNVVRKILKIFKK